MLKLKTSGFLCFFFCSFISFSQAEIPPLTLNLKKIQTSQKAIIKSFAKLPPSITVFGGSRPRVPEDDQIYPWAKSISKQVALDKEIIKTGGLGGFMSAAQDGYREGGGKDSQALDLNRWYSGSPLIKHYFATDRMTLRKWGLIHNTKLFVAFPGAMGTMDEFFETWKRKQEGSLKVPLILAGKEYWGELISALGKPP
jgi:predicted Rossmann-fold nucleotide-binding protein